MLGVEAAGLLVASLTVTPPDGAGEANETVPVAVWPPVTNVGLRTTAFTAGGSIVRLADCDAPLRLAEIEAANKPVTGTVFTVNVADVAPPITDTEVGVVANREPLNSFTVTPWAGAIPLKTTVPVEIPPPTTLGGLKEMSSTTGGLRVIVAA